ncbi:hypothetical protein P153DRAFT_381654 [Dothidotthia symphoricarpi CBS 119687]|uniref:DUF7137 domain-containing protein n=1 Tax=Dothidotthia symphoricarpi CBS 119687 TaxID=1392245 RepID=A0A6A6AQC4_9PLEO|nr:uncharacterized protein P153DRAFT_381654 [Dothidotthia symphoricarpi CBS 119687]KAF2133215.1 hypothetical protein P153DRAFT_381654 [Dothidotthia symphoricarpi CBS 119687]
MRPSQLFAAVLAMSSVATAMPDAFGNLHGLGAVKNLLFGRQNDNSQSTSATARTTASSGQAESTNAASATESRNNDDDASTTAKSTGSGKASTTGTATRVTTTRKGNSTSFDARLPAGGLTMVTPGALAGSQFYKVGDWVTFAWNYTSLSVTPAHLDILATCTANQATYTIAVNQSAQETSVLWNTGDVPDGQAPFLTEKYTLLIYDAQSSVTAAAKAGYLAPFSALSFGMYTPQPYVPFDEFDCVNCNAAFSPFENLTLKAMMITSGTTLASLLYFTYNFGLW